jgi:NIMA (never in mitosis gene a)-related kinase
MSYRTGRLGTLPYNAPEQFNPMLDGKGNPTYKADCWSLGIIIYELVSLKLPFTEKNERELEQIIKRGIFEPLDGPEDLKELVKSLLSRNPDERITYREIKELPFLKEYFKAYKNGTLLEF